MDNLQVLETNGIRVLTTRQIAERYGAEEWQIKQNFANSKKRYIEGKHYILLKGQELREFKNQVENFYLVKNRTSHLYLWTEKGALLHAKSLNTDKAWEVYEYLVDFYFRAKEEPRQQSSEKNEVVPVTTKVEKVPEGLPMKVKNNFVIPEMNHPVMIFHALLELAEEKKIKVRVLDLQACRSMLYKDRIGIRENLSFKEMIYELAYELAHAMIHYDNGNLIESPLRKEYDAQAERAASMLIELLNVKIAKLG